MDKCRRSAMEGFLNGEERYQLVRTLRNMDPIAPREHRRTLRRKVLMSLWMQQLEKNKTPRLSKITLVNVSLNGVGVLCQTSSRMGEKIVLPLSFHEGGGWLVLCEVRRCRRLASGFYLIGGCFIDHIHIEDEKGVAKIPGDWWGYV